MSLDYPFYEELKRRQHKAAKWWRLGDILYYLGLLPGILLFLSLLFGIFFCFIGWGTWVVLRNLFLLFVFCVLIFYLGACLKGKSYKMAKEDGIDVNDY